MLEVFVYGKNKQGYLELPPAASLDMVVNTENFDEDLTLGEYSLPQDVPMTPNNKAIFGFIEMLNSQPAAEQTQWKCDVGNDGIPEMVDSQITLLENPTTFGYDKGTYSMSISGNKGIFGTLIKNKTLKDISWGRIDFPAGATSRDFATVIMKNDPLINIYPYLRFVPCAIMNFFDDTRPDYNGEFIAQDICNNIVITGPTEDEWVFGRPSAADTHVAAVPGTAEYLDHRTIPFFTWKWIMQKVFAEFGYSISGDWLNDAAWDDAVMYNNMAIEKYSITPTYTDNNREILIQQHFPKKDIGLFLADFQKLFNVKLTFNDGRKVSIDYRKKVLKDNRSLDASKIVNANFLGTPTDFKDKGFTLSFNFDTNDGYSGQRVQDIDKNKLVASVNKFGDLATLVIGRPFEYNDLVYVAAENQYFAYTNGAGITAWQYFSERLFPFVIGVGDYKYETGISPMATYILLNADTDNLDNMDMVAADMKGSYFNKHYTLVEQPFETRIFYAKRILKNGNNLPSSFVHNRDSQNKIRVPVSLAWDGAEGLYNYVWKDWLDFLTNTRKVKAKFTFDQKSYSDLKNTNKISIDGTNYLPVTLYTKIPIREEVEVDMYRV